MTLLGAFASVVRAQPVDLVAALVLVAGRAGSDPDPVPVLAELDRLAAEVGIRRRDGLGPHEAMVSVLGSFGGDAESYDALASSLLPDVLRSRRGLPILLSVVWVEVARRAGLPARCLGTPGHVLAEVAGATVDPFHGGAVVPALPDGRARGDAAPTLDGAPLLLRVLANLRALAHRTGDPELALWAVEFSLALPSHPLELRGEHGRLLVRRGRHLEGAVELEAFAEAAPAPHDERARRAARMARAQLN